ncbi:hypothetical protein GCM10022379_12250 [Micromonospora maritima]
MGAVTIQARSRRVRVEAREPAYGRTVVVSILPVIDVMSGGRAAGCSNAGRRGMVDPPP